MSDDRNGGLLASALATRRERRDAYVVMAFLVAALVVTVPFARWPMPAVPQFVPLYDSAIFVLDTLAAVLLYAQFEHLRRRSLVVVACAYVFTPLIVAAHAMSVPNAFVAGTVIGGEQTAAWLWVAWHAVFPLFIGAYALMRRLDVEQAETANATSIRRTGKTGLIATIMLALALIAFAINGDGLMPRLMSGDTQSSSLTTAVLGATCVLHLVALGALVWYTRLRRVLEVWLAVALVALAIDVLLSGALIDARYQVGFYLGRVYGLLGTLFVLGVLLRETASLSAMAARLLDLERTARIDAESAGRAKDHFLAVIGHELRSPLSPITTSLQLMRLRGSETPELSVLERQVAHLTQLVEDLLDVSRIANGKLSLRKQRLELSDVVRRAVEIAAPAIDQRQQRLDIGIEPTGLAVEADPGRLAQAIANLLSNASKYSGTGTRILVRAEKAGDRVKLHVQDEGHGIAPEMIERIFDPFMQQPQTLAHSDGGLGLGLTIVRNLLELHGGSVKALSDGPGRGSEFVVELPLADAHSKNAQPEAAVRG